MTEISHGTGAVLMDERKRYNPHKNVLQATQERIAWTFDEFEKVYVSFSAGKDSTVMLHLVMAEAIKRGRTVGVLIIDLEAQYKATVDNIQACVDLYREHIDLHYWVCLPINLRNAVTNFEPQWTCWDPDARDKWVREVPLDATTHYDWFVDRMEFEEFMVEWGRRADGRRAPMGVRVAGHPDPDAGRPARRCAMTSPCATCFDVARDCASCVAYDDYLAATEPPAPPTCYVCDDVVLLLDCGELLETIAPRIHTRQGTRFTLPALQRHLRDHQRRDLIERDMRRQGFSDAEVGAR